MKPLKKDARSFVDGVVSYLKHEGRVTASLPKVTKLLDKVSSDVKKERSAVVVSATTLTLDEKNRITTLLSRLIGHEVVIESTVRPSLLAGVRIQVGEWIVDTSLETQLTSLAEALI